MRNLSELYIYTDGGARGNPGPAAIGVVVKSGDGKTLGKWGRVIGETTNNTAEYQAVLSGLGWLIKQKVYTEIIRFHLDSQLVVRQLTGKFKIKQPHLRELFIKIKILEKKINSRIFYTEIPRRLNWEADRLVNLALDDKITSP